MEGLLGVVNKDHLIHRCSLASEKVSLHEPQGSRQTSLGHKGMSVCASVIKWESLPGGSLYFQLSLKDLPALIQERHDTDTAQMNNMQMEMQLLKQNKTKGLKKEKEKVDGWKVCRSPP